MGAIDYFREPTDKDIEIFQMAIQLKNQANSLFEITEKKRIDYSKNKFHFFDTSYIPLRDSDKPDELNIYIRKIETTYRETNDIENIPIDPDKKQVDVVEEWTKSYLPNDIIDDNLFYRYLKVIHNLRYIHSLSMSFQKNKSIIFVNLELLCKSDIENSFSLSQLEDEIDSLLSDLYLKAEENGWIIVESYKDFTANNELVKWLDKVNPQEMSYQQIFGNDFVFLNNTDNINGEIDSRLITNHILLERNHDNVNKLFCYTRDRLGSVFHRNTIFFPKRLSKIDYIVGFSDLLKDINTNKDFKDVRQD